MSLHIYTYVTYHIFSCICITFKSSFEVVDCLVELKMHEHLHMNVLNFAAGPWHGRTSTARGSASAAFETWHEGKW